MLQTRFPLPRHTDPLNKVLSSPDHDVHQHIADHLWESKDEDEAVSRLRQLGETLPETPDDEAKVEPAAPAA